MLTDPTNTGIQICNANAATNLFGPNEAQKGQLHHYQSQAITWWW